MPGYIRFLLCLALLALLALHADRASSASVEKYDLIIRGGRIVDGTGNPVLTADVAVRDGRIAAVGRVAGTAAELIDAKGLVVAPGFIDVHTHAENILSRPEAENFIRMGVTSIVAGNCGGSKLETGQFLREVEERGPAVNVATLIGHNTVRSEAMGGAFDRPPTAAELERMKALVGRAMREGALGLSTGLIYLPGTFSRTEEIIELARVAAAHGGIYATHMRNEGTGIFDALAEVFRIAREAGVRAEISHLKLGGEVMWGRAGEVLEAIERARDEGLDITQDQYLYTASSTGISSLIPGSAREGGREAFRRRIAEPGEKERIAAQMRETLRRRGREDYGYAVIARYRPDPSLNGKSVPEAAKAKRGSGSLEDQIELILEIEASGGASGIFHGMSEEDLQVFLRHPNTMFASDSGVRGGEGGEEGLPHPRGYGNNARVLGRYVRELRLLRLEDAVRKMTSLPAAAFGLRERGLVREGHRADLVLFDPKTVRDTATFMAPHQYPVGIPHVFVNGTAVVKDGKPTGARPGTALRRQER